jgi:hypothetical protein
LKLLCDGWLYDVPTDTAYIDVTPMGGERDYVQFFDTRGALLDRGNARILPSAPHWAKRLAAV